jgi:hypothetical protein
MESVVDNLWRIDEMPVIDESTKSYTYNEIRESNINVKELEQYTLETNINGWKHLSGAYIFVKSKIKNNPNNYATISNNGINDFDYVRLFYEEVLIEETNYVGVATLISNLIEFSGDVSDTSASQLCWYPVRNSESVIDTIVIVCDEKTICYEFYIFVYVKLICTSVNKAIY